MIISIKRAASLPPKGWLPVGTEWRDARLYLHWSYFGEERLLAPFFENDVRRSLRNLINRQNLLSMPIDQLPDWLQDNPGLRPNGFIFHLSRCGSTLVSRMLAALAGNVVISEANPIDAVVRARYGRPDLSLDQHAQWLTWMIGALGQPRAGGERHYFIKLDSWHTLALPLFARSFPDVPWIFLYRDPVEVLVSHVNMPGTQMIPGMPGNDFLGVDASDDPRSTVDYCARVLARICEPVLQNYAKDKALLVNYADLPQALSTTIMSHFGVECREDDRAMMEEIARYDSKTPSFEFTPDIERKQQWATATVRAAAEGWVGEIYRKLEALRVAR